MRTRINLYHKGAIYANERYSSFTTDEQISVGTSGELRIGDSRVIAAGSWTGYSIEPEPIEPKSIVKLTKQPGRFALWLGLPVRNSISKISH